MTLEHPVDTPPAELLRQAQEAAASDDQSAAAYHRAIHAIEQAFRQIATPDNPTADLGVVLAHYEERPDLWNERYPTISKLEPAIEMLQHLWSGRPQPEDPFPLQPEAARMAVSIAEAMVHLIEQGYIELLDELTPEEEAEDLALAKKFWEDHLRGERKSRPFDEFLAELDAREDGA